MKEGTILPLMTTVVTGMMDLTTHLNSLNVFVEPVFGYSEHITMTRSYGELRPGRGKINICLQNYSAILVTLPSKLQWGEITPTDVNLTIMAQKPTELEGGD